MLQHFKYERMFPNSELPGWIVSFLYKGKKYFANYEQDGSIIWQSEKPNHVEQCEKMIHELMLFHVYDN
ncbi:DUF5342 family protein [Savagea sp. SN6]|uniref:DUF5342 family protein n=1 Tax=Savagea serpentis TaxID=2785297 RepID=A0A8J7G5V5_9BACL|nr:DUF5342 family protein [Savagea serpentis]MBF4501977.1 DUF5342 family protein [Savagea serpentis]